MAKTVTQKHGMQTLGKAPPARRPGAAPPSVKNISSSSELSQPKSVTLPSNLRQERPPPNPGWTGSMPPPNPTGPPSPHIAVNAPPTGPPIQVS